MAEFQEVIQQKKRMCNSVLCCKCDIYRLCGEDLSKCPQFISNNPKKAEEVIMRWAEEHPEPVYPSWYDYLHNIGVLYNKHTAGGYVTEICWGYMMAPIDDDTAQKLGLQPKEGV